MQKIIEEIVKSDDDDYDKSLQDFDIDSDADEFREIKNLKLAKYQ